MQHRLSHRTFSLTPYPYPNLTTDRDTRTQTAQNTSFDHATRLLPKPEHRQNPLAPATQHQTYPTQVGPRDPWLPTSHPSMGQLLRNTSSRSQVKCWRIDVGAHRFCISCEETIPTFRLNTKKLEKLKFPGNNNRRSKRRRSCWRGLQR
jgi:hypothetical protein